MRARFERPAKLALFCGLAVIFYKGVTGIPEVATRLSPESFFSSFIQNAEGTLVMKERLSDFYRQTSRALALRLEEPAGAGEPPDQTLADKERVQLALTKTRVKEARTDADLGLIREKLERGKRLKAERWTMGWFRCDALPDSLRQGACEDDEGLAAKRVRGAGAPDALAKREGPTP